MEPPSTTPRAISNSIRRPLRDRSVIGGPLLGSGIEMGTWLAAPFYPIGAAGTIAWVTLSVGGEKSVSIPGEGEVEAWVVQTTDGRLNFMIPRAPYVPRVEIAQGSTRRISELVRYRVF